MSPNKSDRAYKLALKIGARDYLSEDEVESAISEKIADYTVTSDRYPLELNAKGRGIACQEEG